ncbi:hypothetical protein [Candidatus Palauibacter sp.]|uniref:hypothetical protein n=1 Tax=Candidatus Palauibacter sp. TaxID=3101350 RepID=UPI003B02A324
MRTRHRIAIPMFVFVLAFPSAAPAQEREQALPPMTQRVAARTLMYNALTPERGPAIRLAIELGPRASEELKAAVIHAAWAEVRGEIDRPEESEALFDYMWAAARLRDERAIPFLVRIMAHGPAAANALADLGNAAFPQMLEVVMNPDADGYGVDAGFRAIRFMYGDGSLTERQVSLAREAARERLSGTQAYPAIRGALELAIVLLRAGDGDAELGRTVERLATDRATAEALLLPEERTLVGHPRPDRPIEWVQEDARRWLTGEAIKPSRIPVSG